MNLIYFIKYSIIQLYNNSGSMEKSFYKGDLLLLWWNTNRPSQAGDIVIYNIKGKVPNIPIVHRVLNVHTE